MDFLIKFIESAKKSGVNRCLIIEKNNSFTLPDVTIFRCDESQINLLVEAIEFDNNNKYGIIPVLGLEDIYFLHDDPLGQVWFFLPPGARERLEFFLGSEKVFSNAADYLDGNVLESKEEGDQDSNTIVSDGVIFAMPEEEPYEQIESSVGEEESQDFFANFIGNESKDVEKTVKLEEAGKIGKIEESFNFGDIDILDEKVDNLGEVEEADGFSIEDLDTITGDTEVDETGEVEVGEISISADINDLTELNFDSTEKVEDLSFQVSELEVHGDIGEEKIVTGNNFDLPKFKNILDVCNFLNDSVFYEVLLTGNGRILMHGVDGWLDSQSFVDKKDLDGFLEPLFSFLGHVDRSRLSFRDIFRHPNGREFGVQIDKKISGVYINLLLLPVISEESVNDLAKRLISLPGGIVFFCGTQLPLLSQIITKIVDNLVFKNHLISACGSLDSNLIKNELFVSTYCDYFNSDLAKIWLKSAVFYSSNIAVSFDLDNSAIWEEILHAVSEGRKVWIQTSLSADDSLVGFYSMIGEKSSWLRNVFSRCFQVAVNIDNFNGGDPNIAFKFPSLLERTKISKGEIYIEENYFNR